MKMLNNTSKIFSKIIKLLLTIILFIFITITILSPNNNRNYLVNAKDAGAVKCNQFDDLFNDLTIVSSAKRNFPTNPDEFVDYCKKSTSLANQIGTLIKSCFNDTMKNVASVMLYSYRNRAKTLCKNKSSKRSRSLMEAASCLNQHKSKMSKCIDATAYRIGEAKNKPDNLKFPYMCCEAVNFHKCIDKIQAGDCKEQIQVFTQTVNSITSGFSDGSCGEYNPETDKCEQLTPITVKKGGSKPSLARNAAELLASIGSR